MLDSVVRCKTMAILSTFYCFSNNSCIMVVFCFSHKSLRAQIGQCSLAEVVKIVENETISERKYTGHQWNGIIRKRSE